LAVADVDVFGVDPAAVGLGAGDDAELPQPARVIADTRRAMPIPGRRLSPTRPTTRSCKGLAARAWVRRLTSTVAITTHILHRGRGDAARHRRPDSLAETSAKQSARVVAETRRAVLIEGRRLP